MGTARLRFLVRIAPELQNSSTTTLKRVGELLAGVWELSTDSHFSCRKTSTPFGGETKRPCIGRMQVVRVKLPHVLPFAQSSWQSLDQCAPFDVSFPTICVSAQESMKSGICEPSEPSD